MAALSEQRFNRYPGTLVDLRHIHPSQLDTLLAQETQEWRETLDWDFGPSTDLVRRFIHMKALSGVALRTTDPSGKFEYVGYAYYVADEGKGLIGGLYVAPQIRTPEIENMLLTSVLETLWRTTGVRRVEAQLMMLTSPLDREIPFADCFQPHPRQFLQAPLSRIADLPARHIEVTTAPWTESRHSDAARLIAASYVNHIDSHINDQYRSAGGARRFLTNIVQYPGCGSFFPPASFVALSRPSNTVKSASVPRMLGYDTSTLTLSGVCLASLVSNGVGHVTQVCVSPAERGTGLGYELLRRSMVALAAHDCHTVTLTVTNANTAALDLYERMGFTCRREFAAYVWNKS